jgi:tetratricopeptide (TPR) repeat protein
LKDGWYDLGLANAGANRHADAIAAFRKQIELDPNHKHANGDLAMELQQTGKTDEAIAAYRKQLETAPYEKRRSRISACCWRSWDAMPTHARNWKRPPRFLRMIRKRRWRWRRCMGDLGEKTLAQELMKGLTGSAGGIRGRIFMRRR